MANPVIEDIVDGVWKSVATNVTSGMVLPVTRDADFYYTIRETGGLAPTGSAEYKELPYVGGKISSSIAIDIYVTTIGGNGKVRVDVP